MTRLELAEKLNHLDPGGCLPVEKAQLEEMFGPGPMNDEMVQAIEAFAEAHRCTFAHHGHGHAVPEFTKDDVF